MAFRQSSRNSKDGRTFAAPLTVHSTALQHSLNSGRVSPSDHFDTCLRIDGVNPDIMPFMKIDGFSVVCHASRASAKDGFWFTLEAPPQSSPTSWSFLASRSSPLEPFGHHPWPAQ